jgi:hypothetical protein
MIRYRVGRAHEEECRRDCRVVEGQSKRGWKSGHSDEANEQKVIEIHKTHSPVNVSLYFHLPFSFSTSASSQVVNSSTGARD